MTTTNQQLNLGSLLSSSRLDIRDRIAGLQTLLGLPVSRKFIVYPGETPWWDIEDPAERCRAYNRQWQRVERKLHPERNVEKTKRYNKKHPGIHSDRMREFYESHPGYNAETTKRYRKTPKGRAAVAKGKAKRREFSTDPDLYSARVELLHIMQEPCAKCGTPFKVTHQVDHIIALCLGGTDDWSNLQPLCIRCHREKTAEDLRKFKEIGGTL